jgi:chitodextrinase
MRLTRSAVLTFAAFLMTPVVQAATLYVSTSGNDSNTGTLSSPYRTITKAAYYAKPGDTVQVRGGTYYEIVKIQSKGTSSARITFEPYPGEKVIIDGTGSASGTNLVQLTSTDWVDFRGFEVRNATRIGICAYGALNTRILNNTVYNSVKGGIYVGASGMGGTTDIVVSGNTVRNNVLENQYHSSSSGWSQAVGINKAVRVQVTSNKVYQNDGEAIAFVLSDHGLAAQNEVFDNYSVGIYLDNARYTTVDRNFVHSTGNTRYYRDSKPAHGIGMANESYSTSNPLTDNRITNNVVLRARRGLFYGNYENGGGLKNTTVSNNTFYDATDAVLGIDSSSHSNSFIQNNVFVQATGRDLAIVAGSGITYRNNNWYGGSPGSAAGSGDIVGNPQFVRAGGTAAADYRLTSAAPVIEKGLTVSGLSVDYWGTTRTISYDIGAHEFSSGTTSTADTTPPTAPTNLTATASGSSTIDLRWDASTDNVGVTGYKIYRNGAHVATVSGTSWSNTGLAASTTYSYSVAAIDAAGNQSSASNTASATTAAASTADTTAPTAPTNLTATAASTSSISLSWGASSDNVGVTGYRIYRNSSLVATVSGTSYTDSGLASGTTYSYFVRAIDAAGNVSAASNTASATTPSSTGTTKKRPAKS